MKSFLYFENSVRNELDLICSDSQASITLDGPFEARQISSSINKNNILKEPVKPSTLYLSGLIQGYCKLLISQYSTDSKIPLQTLIKEEKKEEWDHFFQKLDRHYPTINKTPSKEERVLDAILILLQNLNPAFKSLKNLFSDKDLPADPYKNLFVDLAKNFSIQNKPKEWNQDLVSLLLSLLNGKYKTPEEQIEFIIKTNNFNQIAFERKALLLGLDFAKEDNKIGLPGPGPVEGIDYSFIEDDKANFSLDSDWMPKVILLAKNAYVWMDQLSKQYKQQIDRLDKIPDEELWNLHEQGITGLWLIGLWERSPASKKIKQICGNPEAEASAYSLKNYSISNYLGGEEALSDLKARCLKFGIRLASDMVPNHTGIDSDWMIEHPEYFLSRKTLPYPNYSFTGMDYSPQKDISIYLEDGYYDQSDASVVFKYINHKDNTTKYFYHGNDGTSMPWNDTAQLDFSKKELREAVIDQIMEVAKQFPIIRFDAAMTLARKHIQRLWFPKPGEGGAIPSRSEYSLSEEEFNKMIPDEFWREVVDRINLENPETLLLAEAFWMMEGYFVRNLGMHRVYNSAFMNLLKTEDNKEFHKLLRETLSYDPQILKRFVNFMNNPDEDTAIEQFGKGAKYFGVCTMMLTLPGLPMIGHGQFEGFYEKYGMEYKKAYHNESIDQDLLDRHRREIFPIMKERSTYSGSNDFHLYPFFISSLEENFDVFAYSNAFENANSLVFYNNTNIATSGWIQKDIPKAINREDGQKIGEERKTFSEIFNLKINHFLLLFDQKKGLWFIYKTNTILKKGLAVSLNAYEVKLFSKIEQREDDREKHLENLYIKMNGKGFPNLKRAIRFSEIEPAIHVLKTFFNKKMIDTPIMTDLITSLSSDLNKGRRLINIRNKKRTPRSHNIYKEALESVILPSLESLFLSNLEDDELFYMALYYHEHKKRKAQCHSTLINYIQIFEEIINNELFTPWFGINEYKNITWFDGEKMRKAMWWIPTVEALQLLGSRTDEAFKKEFNNFEASYRIIYQAIVLSEYKVKNLINWLNLNDSKTIIDH